MKHTPEQLASVVAAFQWEGRFVEASTLGSGHIHDTYRLTYAVGGDRKRCVLQRINHDVFGDPVGLMENLVRVTAHVRGWRGPGGFDAFPELYRTREGGYAHRDERGNTWRMMGAIDDAHTVEGVGTERQIYEASKAFGTFLRLLDDFPEPPLCETIPNFHEGAQRYTDLMGVVARDPCGRVALAGPEIDFVTECRSLLFEPDALMRAETLHTRVTHNDTKIDNVLLHRESDRALCVIDLDTVMPGLALYDIGDILRTAAGTAAEDERDLSLVRVEMHRVECIVRGFLQGAGDALTPAERESLVLGGSYMSLLIGLRFLIDFLQGDTYFKTERDGHNLDRCRAQFCLSQQFKDRRMQIQEIVRRCQETPEHWRP